MEEKERQNHIVYHNTNCQVFNGPISGCVFAMPGSNVTNAPVQQVDGNGNASVKDEGVKSDNADLIVSVPDDLPIVIMQAPEKTFKSATNGFVIKTIQNAGSTCVEPWHFACLMAVCDDHGILIDRTAATNFARTMVAWGIKKFESEDDIRQLANSMGYTMNKLPLKYKEWNKSLLSYRNKCESLATYFGESMPYRYGLKKP